MNTLCDIIDRLLAGPRPFAVFFYPGTSEPELVLQQTAAIHKLNSIDDLNNRRGFVFAPFATCASSPLVIIDPDLHRKGFRDIAGLRELLPPAGPRPARPAAEQGDIAGGDIGKTEYLQLLNSLIEQIKDNKFDKVIISRTISAELPRGLSPGRLLLKLKEKVDNAFVYLVGLPGIGVWLGGTPELLLVKKNGSYHTVALAGTVPVNGGRQEIAWSPALRREQQIVTDFVAAQLQAFEIENYAQTGPVTEYAGNVAHLKTTFELAAGKIENRLPSFIEAIHPGPAICGFPKETAREYIRQNEKHRREYYCGFLGNWQIEGDLRLFINIRCLKITGNRAVIYVGGGITANSVPECEWEETSHKAQLLLAAIRSG